MIVKRATSDNRLLLLLSSLCRAREAAPVGAVSQRHVRRVPSLYAAQRIVDTDIEHRKAAVHARNEQLLLLR